MEVQALLSAQCFALGSWGNTASPSPFLKGIENISDLTQATASLWIVIVGLSPVLKVEENLYEKYLEVFELVYKSSCLKGKKKDKKQHVKQTQHQIVSCVSTYCN